jgi:hypothetical protein
LVFAVQSPEDILKEGLLFGWINVAGKEVLEELSDFLVGLGFEHDGLGHYFGGFKLYRW